MKIPIESEYINLGQFLKLANVISSGGEAKFAVKELNIKVNGVLENRRGRKLYPKDKLEIEGKTFEIV